MAIGQYARRKPTVEATKSGRCSARTRAAADANQGRQGGSTPGNRFQPLPSNVRPDLDPKWLDCNGNVRNPENDGFTRPTIPDILPPGIMIDRFGGRRRSLLQSNRCNLLQADRYHLNAKLSATLVTA